MCERNDNLVELVLSPHQTEFIWLARQMLLPPEPLSRGPIISSLPLTIPPFKEGT